MLKTGVAHSIPPNNVGRIDKGDPTQSRLRQILREAGSQRRWPYLFVLPAVGAITAAFIYPLVEVVRFSFYSGSVGNLTFIGAGNYRGLAQDPVFVHSVLNNLKLLATVPIMTVIALVVALILNTQVRGWRQYRAIIFLPYILPATSIGLTFSYLLSQSGILNTLLRQWHLGAIALDWLGSGSLVIPTIGAVVIWQQLGFGVVVFAAALLAVPQEIIEAARMDGAHGWQIPRYVLVPHIRRVIEFFMMLEAITVLSSIFTYVFVLTKGGPGNTSSIMEYYIFQNGFENGAIGVASAAAVILLLLASVFIFGYLRLGSHSKARVR